MEYIGESERQASPEKLYRAALLRSRFADTIVKAREKLITQVGNSHLFYSRSGNFW